MIKKLTPNEATYLLNSAKGRELIKEALDRPNHLDASGRAALMTVLEYPPDETMSRELGRILLLSNPHRVGLDNILSKLFLHSGIDLNEHSDGAQIIEKGYETIAVSNAFEFIRRLEKRQGAIRFSVRFSGIDELRFQFIYHMNILAKKLFDEETEAIKDEENRFLLSKEEFKKRVTKLYAITMLPGGGIDVFDFSRLMPYQLDVVSKRYANFTKGSTTFYAHGPKAVHLVREIASLDPNNRVVFVGSPKKSGGGQFSGGGTGSPQAIGGGGDVIPFPGIARHAGHVHEGSSNFEHGHGRMDEMDIATNAKAAQSISSMIAAGIAVPMKPVR